MASVGSFVKQIGHYSLSSLAVMVAGLISYPILTRVLAVEEYGVMGAVVTLLNIFIGISKMGLHPSASSDSGPSGPSGQPGWRPSSTPCSC